MRTGLADPPRVVSRAVREVRPGGRAARMESRRKERDVHRIRALWWCQSGIDPGRDARGAVRAWHRARSDRGDISWRTQRSVHRRTPADGRDSARARADMARAESRTGLPGEPGHRGAGLPRGTEPSGTRRRAAAVDRTSYRDRADGGDLGSV